MNHDDRLRAHLAEDTGSPAAAEELLPLARRLAALPAPQPDAHARAQLVAQLSAQQAAQARARQARVSAWPARLAVGWAVLWAQLRIVQAEVWAGSALVIALGAVVALVLDRGPAAAGALPFVLVAPLAAAAGVAGLYGPAADPALEITLASPVSPRLVLLARLVWLFGFNLLAGLLASVLLTFVRAELSLWPLVLAWLAPMTFLSALAFLLGVLLRDPATSMVFTVGLWGLQIMRQAPFFAGLIPDLIAASAQPWLFASALVLAALAFWRVGQNDAWLDSPI